MNVEGNDQRTQVSTFDIQQNRIFFDDVLDGYPIITDSELVQLHQAGYHRVTRGVVPIETADVIHKWGHELEGGNERCKRCDEVKWGEAGFMPLLDVYIQPEEFSAEQ